MGSLCSRRSKATVRSRKVKGQRRKSKKGSGHSSKQRPRLHQEIKGETTKEEGNNKKTEREIQGEEKSKKEYRSKMLFQAGETPIYERTYNGSSTRGSTKYTVIRRLLLLLLLDT